MSKKYKKCFPTGVNSVSIDPRWAFEVASGKITTYSVEKKGLLRRPDYTETGSRPITKETTVTITDGMCKVSNPKGYRDYPVVDVDEFAAEVRAEVNRAPS